MNQIWETEKNLNIGTNFGLFGPNLVPEIFFHKFYGYWMLYIVSTYHFMQYQGQLIN